MVEIRKVCAVGLSLPNDGEIVILQGSQAEDNDPRKEEVADLTTPEMDKVDSSAVINFEDRLDGEMMVNRGKEAHLNESRDDDETDLGPSPPFEHSTINNVCHEPPVLLGVVEEGEKFDFCMCNPPFFESMEEAGLNPKTSCGGTPQEMVCPGGERAFISRIIEDSVALKQSFRYRASLLVNFILLNDIVEV